MPGGRFRLVTRKMAAMKRANRVGAIMHPCLTSVSILNGLDLLPPFGRMVAEQTCDLEILSARLCISLAFQFLTSQAELHQLHCRRLLGSPGRPHTMAVLALCIFIVETVSSVPLARRMLH